MFGRHGARALRRHRAQGSVENEYTSVLNRTLIVVDGFDVLRLASQEQGERCDSNEKLVELART